MSEPTIDDLKALQARLDLRDGHVYRIDYLTNLAYLRVDWASLRAVEDGEQ
jgi:hypothetical protein